MIKRSVVYVATLTAMVGSGFAARAVQIRHDGTNMDWVWFGVGVALIVTAVGSVALTETVSRDDLVKLYVDVLDAYSPRRGAQYVAAMLFTVDTGDVAHGIFHSAFATYEEDLYWSVRERLDNLRANGRDDG